MKLTQEQAREIASSYRNSLKIQNEIGFGDVPYRAPDIDFYEDEPMFYDSGRNEIHLGIFGIVNVFNVESEAEFVSATNYARGHEEQHRRSTVSTTYAWGISRSVEVILEYISAREEKSKRRFRTHRDYENFANQVLPGMGIYINYQMLTQILAGLANSVEDGRIERIRAKRFPGFEKMRRYFRGKFWMRYNVTYKPYALIKDNPAEKLQLIANQILSLATCQLYSKGFAAAYAGTPLMDEVKTLMPHIALGVMAGCTRDMAFQVIELAKKLAPYIYEVCKISATDMAIRKALEQMLTEMVKSMIDAMPDNTGLTEAQEDTDDGGATSTFPNSDLTIELDDEAYDKLTKNTNPSKDGKGLMIKRKHPKEQEESKGERQSAGKKSGTTDRSGDKSEAGKPSDAKEQPSKKEAESNAQPADVEASKDDNHEGQDSQGGQGGQIQSHDAHGCADMSAIREAMEKAAEEVNETAKRQVETLQRTQAHAQKTIERVVPDTAKTLTAKDVKDICDNFKEVKRAYKLTENLPPVLAARGRTLLRKNQQYFKSLSTPNVSFLDSGSVDPSRIYGLSFGDTEIFRKKGIDKKFDGCAYILIDNSGSMSGEKKVRACQAAALIEESFRGLIPIKIVAFDAASIVIHEVIKGWDEQQNKNCCWNYCLHGRDGGGTPDGYALQIAIRETQLRPEPKKLVIILCDGGGQADIVQQAVRYAKKNGIHVNSIFIDDSGRNNASWFTSQYKDADKAIVCSPDELDVELGAMMKKFSRT